MLILPVFAFIQYSQNLPFKHLELTTLNVNWFYLGARTLWSKCIFLCKPFRPPKLGKYWRGRHPCTRSRIYQTYTHTHPLTFLHPDVRFPIFKMKFPGFLGSTISVFCWAHQLYFYRVPTKRISFRGIKEQRHVILWGKKQSKWLKMYLVIWTKLEEAMMTGKMLKTQPYDSQM